MSDAVQDQKDQTKIQGQQQNLPGRTQNFPIPPQTDGTLSLQAPLAKEQKEALGPAEPEKAPIVELKEPEPSKEVEGWIEKLEKGEEVQLPQPILDDYGQILVQSAAPQKPKIVLPLDAGQVASGLSQKVVNSIRWLAEWCLRLLKMWPERVEYKKN